MKCSLCGILCGLGYVSRNYYADYIIRKIVPYSNIFLNENINKKCSSLRKSHGTLTVFLASYESWQYMNRIGQEGVFRHGTPGLEVTEKPCRYGLLRPAGSSYGLLVYKIEWDTVSRR